MGQRVKIRCDEYEGRKLWYALVGDRCVLSAEGDGPWKANVLPWYGTDAAHWALSRGEDTKPVTRQAFLDSIPADARWVLSYEGTDRR